MENRSTLNEGLSAIKQQVLDMGLFVEEALQRAITALINQDEKLARQVVDDDIHIDKYQNQIEDACTRIIAREQPVASDLRVLVISIKIVSNLERIGDHARHLARSLSLVDKATMEYLITDIKLMTKQGIDMLHQSLTAFSLFDADLAQAVAKKDAILDQQHQALYSKIIEMMKKNPKKIKQGTTLLFLNRFLERLGDHVITICEWIVYANTGVHSELKT